MGRLNQDDYLWSLAFQAAARSTCDRGRHGCVVAREGVVLATGYNGSAPGEPHCDEDGHLLIHHIPVNPANPEVGVLGESHCIRTIHAEMNAVINAALVGVSLKGCDWYITGVPCQRCSMAISRLRPAALYLRSDFGDPAALSWWWKRAERYGIPLIFPANLKELTKRGVIPECYRKK